MNDSEARAHFFKFGIAEGRIGAPECLRERFTKLIPRGARVLEIGPFDTPVLRGKNVQYADVLTSDALRARARDLGRNPNGVPDIHYPIPDLDLRRIEDRFDAVLSSHCVEHQPDLVRHLQAVENLLTEGGSYFLIIPDKRYCFDYFLPPSTLADVMTAYVRKNKVHEVGSIIEHLLMTTHNDAARHWSGDHGQPRIKASVAPVKQIVANYEGNPDQYVDVHAWQFTPESFAVLSQQLLELELVRMRPVAVYNTPKQRLEFCAVLRKLSG
jgi:SAM-dependent methyltransferase